MSDNFTTYNSFIKFMQSVPNKGNVGLVLDEDRDSDWPIHVLHNGFPKGDIPSFIDWNPRGKCTINYENNTIRIGNYLFIKSAKSQDNTYWFENTVLPE